MATGGRFSDYQYGNHIGMDASFEDQSEQEEDSMLCIVENISLGSDASSCEDEYLQTESVPSTVSTTPLWRLHDSCETPCKKRLYNAVIHCCQADIPLARRVKALFEKMTVAYFDVQYQVAVALLTGVTPNTEFESLHEVFDNDMTTVFIILHTHNYDSDYKSKSVGLKISNAATKSSSIVAIELFFDGDLMRQNEPELLRRVFYEPEQREFQETMRTILMGSSFEEHIRHHEIRQACDEERRSGRQHELSVGKKKKGRINRTKASPLQGNVEESTTESDSLSALRQLDLAARRGSHKNKGHRFKHSNTESSDDTSRSSRSNATNSSGYRGDYSSSTGSEMEVKSKDDSVDVETRLTGTHRQQGSAGARGRVPEQRDYDRNVSSRSDNRRRPHRLLTDSPSATSDVETCRSPLTYLPASAFVNLQSDHLKDHSEISSSSASEVPRENRRHRETNFQQGISEEDRTSNNDQHLTNNPGMSSPSDQEHIGNDPTSACKTSNNMDSEIRLSRRQNPPYSALKSSPKICIARVAPMLQPESNDHNENGENEQNNHSGENDEDEQTFRKLPYTATTFQETPTISCSDCTAANSSQAASPQENEQNNHSGENDEDEQTFRRLPYTATTFQETPTISCSDCTATNSSQAASPQENEQNNHSGENDEDEQTFRRLPYTATTFQETPTISCSDCTATNSSQAASPQENEQNNHSGENDEDEQTFRRLPYTATTFQETPTIFCSDCTAANSSQAASPQDLPTTQLPAAINHSQPDSASCPSGEHETIDLSVTNSVSAELMTVERSEDHGNGGDGEERNGDGATGHQELQDAAENSSRRRPRNLLSRMLSRFRYLLCSSRQSEKRLNS